MNKVLIVSLILLIGVKSLYTQEEIKLKELQGVDLCLRGKVSQLAQGIPCTLAEKAKLFVAKHDQEIRLGLLGSSFVAQFGLYRLFYKKIDICEDGLSEAFALFATRITVPFLALLPVLGARSLLNVIKDIPVLFEEVEKSEEILKSKISTLTWTEKQIEDFFTVSDTSIYCNNRNGFLKLLESSEDFDENVKHFNCLREDIAPQLRVLTRTLYTLSSRLGSNDEYYRTELNNLTYKLDFNCSVIRAVLDETVSDDDFKDVSDDIGN